MNELELVALAVLASLNELELVALAVLASTAGDARFSSYAMIVWVVGSLIRLG